MAVAPSKASSEARIARLWAFVSLESDGELIAVDLGSRRIIRRIKVGRGAHNVASSADGRYVLVTSPPAGRLTLVAARSLRIVAVFSGLSSPHDVEFSPGGRYAYATEEDSGTLLVVDLARRRITRRVRVGSSAHDLAVSADGSWVWLTHGPSEPELTLLQLPTPGQPRVAGSARGGGAAHDLAFSPSGRRVLVTYWGGGQLGSFDARSHRFLGARRIGSEPHHMAFTPGGDLWVTDNSAATVEIVEAEGRGRLRSVSIGPAPHHIAVRDQRAVVAVHGTGSIVVLDLEGKRLAAIPVGPAPHGVVLVRAG